MWMMSEGFSGFSRSLNEDAYHAFCAIDGTCFERSFALLRSANKTGARVSKRMNSTTAHELSIQVGSMRRLIALISTLITLLTLMQLATEGSLIAQQPAFLTNGLVGFYTFNGNANDTSGNASHGAVAGAELAADRFGRTNSAYRFNGTKPQRIVTQPKTLLYGEFSASLWVTAEPGIQRETYVLGSGSNGSRWFGLRYQLFAEATTSSGYKTAGPGVSAGAPYSPITYQFTPDSNLWVHVVTTIGRGYLSVYVNGLLVGKSEAGSMAPPPSGKLIIGDFEDQIVGKVWMGRIDDVRFYNRCLSGEEVSALHQYESTLEQPTPRAGVATAQVVNGFVVGATVIDGGAGYTENPVVSIVGGGGVGAKALATQVNGSVTKISITNPGSGYTSAPTIILSSPPFPPRRATASSSIVNGFVVAATLTDGGAGYQTAPMVLIIDGGGTGATAEAVVAGGTVVGINITNPGKGYTTPPRVSIASPPFSPELAIRVKTVSVHMKVLLGRKYRLESSVDMVHWNSVGSVFVVQEEELIQDFDVDDVGRFFRIQQVL